MFFEGTMSIGSTQSITTTVNPSPATTTATQTNRNAAAQIAPDTAKTEKTSKKTDSMQHQRIDFYNDVLNDEKDIIDKDTKLFTSHLLNKKLNKYLQLQDNNYVLCISL